MATTKSTTRKKTTTKRPATGAKASPKKKTATAVSKLTPAPEQTKTVVVNGIELSLTYEQVNDFRFVDALQQVESGANPLEMASIMRTICGDKYQEVLASLEEPNGRIPVEKVGEFVEEFMLKMGGNNPN